MKDDFTRWGFETLSADPLDEYRARGLYLRHSATGAEIYRVLSDDTENLFSFAFRTPPADHTGVAHILEHSVLCGSENYPLKDPFLVLLKGSAHTFLNAMTYPDKTVYPAASTVSADFLNLFKVYGDAVFFPQLKREAFEQEGHRVEFDGEGRLVRAGIVLNEMKGNYSSAESVAGDWTLRSLFPDSPYGWDSGGDPEYIPTLTFEAFKAFHHDYYHPSNARIFLYGDHDTDEVLSVLDGEFLSKFDRRSIKSDIQLQKPWDSPRRMQAYWPAAPDEREGQGSTISLNWMLGDSTDPMMALSAQVLSFVLLGHGGSPLQKSIIDSGIGEDLSPVSGLETDLRQMVFSAAVRGAQAEKSGSFEDLVLGTLENLVINGVDRDLIEGALRTVEFRAREIRGGSPFGMRLMKRALRGWLHDRPPVESLVFEKPMNELRSTLKDGYFESIIRTQLLENTHRSTVVVSPDKELQIKRDEEDRKVLDVLHDEMKAEDGAMAALNQSLEKLEIFQEEPDSPENLSRIPFLARTDLPEEVRKLTVTQGNQDGISWFRHDTFANGVAYCDMAFDVSGLAPELQCWLPLFGRALTDVGLPGLSYGEVAKELALKTGGLGCSLEASPIHPEAGGGLSLKLFIHLKALATQWDDALAITLNLMKSADFDDLERIRDLLLELRNDYRSAVVPSGNAFAALRAAAKHSEAASWEDLWYGIGQLLFLQDETAGDVKKASEALIAIRDNLFCKDRLSLVVTADPDVSEIKLQSVLETVDSLPAKSATNNEEPELFRHDGAAEGLAAASAVSFSALTLPAPILGTPGHARAGLLAHILRTGFLWEAIRMKGGAYGASASIAGLEGTFTFTTYRDPVILPSLEAFKKSLDWARNELDDSTVDLAVIGSVSKELRPLGPGERGFIAFKRKLYGISDSLRQNRRNVQLAVTADELRDEASKLLDVWDERTISVVAGTESLDQAAVEIPEFASNRLVLPS